MNRPAARSLAPSPPSPNDPADLPRRFMLYRFADPSGVAGVGHVADGAWFPSGWVVVAWLGRWSVAHPWPSLEHVRAIHGHNGATRIAWHDPAPDGTWEAPDGATSDLRASEIDRLYRERRTAFDPRTANKQPDLSTPQPLCPMCGQPVQQNIFNGWVHTNGSTVCPAPYIGIATGLAPL